ncbi:hypothetical protein QCA50_005912 [Cerrena zonata]|uniref:Selenoprotein O n=1 Tax=Cerrena zonata TaxID=2478898 RepID=A0AAW0GGH9_9APHY
MDVFDQFHICNHSDAEGRYSYKAQPSMIVYALRSLLNALAPLVGAEIESGAAVSSGWAEGASKEKIGEWSQKALEHTKEEMEILIQETSGTEYGRIMHRRLGLRQIDKEDEGNLSRPLLNLMGDHRLDFHSTFRRLAYFRPSIIQPENKEILETYISSILALTPEPNLSSVIERERNEWVKDGAEGEVDLDSAREKEAKEANPRFVLRQWVLEEVIKAVEKDASSGKRILRKVLQMACRPFDSWGAEDTLDDAELDEETKEERRFCGIGERKMLGFQCSCSS